MKIQKQCYKKSYYGNQQDETDSKSTQQ